MSRFKIYTISFVGMLYVLAMGHLCPIPAQGVSASSFIGLRVPGPQDPRVPLSDEDPFLGLHKDGLRSQYVKVRISNFKRDISLDSTGQNIEFVEKIGDQPFRLPTYMTLDNYIRQRREQNLKDQWKRTVFSNLGERSRYGSRGRGGLRIDIPVEIKSKAFQQIFGSGTVGLDVTGEINIKGGFRHEKRSEVKTAINRGSDYNFKMEQTQRFKVQGHIGDKVTIGIDQDSERAFEFENNIMLKYEGYEDEIIQSIEAGNISLALPGTRFVQTGGGSSGLFGIKMAAQVGRLKFTAVASQEKGEKKKMSLSGGASEDANTIQDYQYRTGVYYFLDDLYQENYRLNEDGEVMVDGNHEIVEIEVYKSEARYQQAYAEAVRGWAWMTKPEDQERQVITEYDTSRATSENHRGYFLRLEKDEYYVDKQVGFIRMNMPLGEGEVLAVAFKDKSGRIRGNIDFDPVQDDIVQLRMLKSQNPRPSDLTWDLEWKNVYYLGSRNIPKDGLEIRLFYKPASGDPQETIVVDGQKMTYLQLFGLDQVNESGDPQPDNIIDNNPNIINLALGEIYFPNLRPFDPDDPGYPDDKRTAAIYDTTVQSVINAESKFYLEVKSQTRSAEYRLGMNIIENSEEVLLNGRRLQRGSDYTIDYFTGTLRLLNEQATAANANLDISYESNQLFQIDKKTVMGARAEYDLWDDSFIGATMMYLNERTLDQKIRVGKGPMRNFIWDVNTSLSFKPFFLTRFANFLPFVDTRTPSSITFEGEIAQIVPNPNTRNNPDTDDNDGVAYIDDFETAKRETPINISKQSWNFASPPHGKFDYNNPDLSARGRMYYYNPYNPTLIKEIWPTRDVNANVAQTVPTLKLHISPADSIADIKDSWNGIQMALSPGYRNQTEAKFLEIWIRAYDGNMHIDIGQISEDIIPNQRFDTEDELRNSYRNDLLDEGEDVGLDGMPGRDPNDFWDLNGNGVQDYGEPTSWDDWKYDSGNKIDIDYTRNNGTEGNENDRGGRRPDTEDMNENGDVDFRNDYFSYRFSLRRDSEDAENYMVGGKGLPDELDKGWRQYRIPLDALEPTLSTVGTPDMSLVEYIRIWFDGFEESGEHVIQIADIKLVGSEWKEMGTSDYDDPENFGLDQEPKVTATVVNTHDNPDYVGPPGVSGERDRVTQVIYKEQALVLDVENLLPGESGILQKTFYDPQDYINYRTMKMFVYGHDMFGQHMALDSSRVEFFLRFGADTENYYEVRKRIHEGWIGNNIEIDLTELSTIKELPEYQVWTDSAKTEYIHVKHLDDRTRLIVKGRPALRNVRTLVAGVKNMHHSELGMPAETTGPFNGQVWINELRLSNVKKDKGIAMRARLDVTWADLIRFNGEMNKMDADFHNVSTRFGDGDNQISGNFNTTVQVDKFLPAKLGVSIPVSLNYARNEATPKYIPGTDVEVTDALPDTTITKIESVREKQGYSVGFSVNSRSQNFFVKHLLSSLRANYSRNQSFSRDSRTKRADNTQESGKLDWGINFSRDNYFRPFGWLGESRMARILSDMKLYYSPQSVRAGISGARSSQETLTRGTEIFSSNSSFNISRDMSSNVKIFESLTLDYSRGYTNDMRDVPGDSVIAYLKNLNFGLLTDVDQNFSIKYSPKLFSWLTTNFSYSTGFKYGYNRQQKLANESATQSRNFQVSGNFNLKTLMNSIYRPGAPTGRNRGGRRPAPRRNQPANGEEGKEGEENEQEDDGTSIFGYAKFGVGLFFKLFEVFEPFTVNYNERSNMTAYGIDGIPDWGFQFGLSDSVKLKQSDVDVGAASFNRNSSSDNTNISASSGFSLGRDVRITLKYDDMSSLNSSTQITGQRSRTWIDLFDATFNETFPLPDWSVRIGGLEKLPLINNYVQRVSLDHSYTGKYSETYNVENGEEVVSKEDYDSQFRPLAGFTMSWKNGISMQMRYNISERNSLSQSFGVGGTKQTKNDIQLTASYSKSSDFSIPVWPFNTMRLKNSIDFQFTFSMSEQQTLKSRAGGDYEVTAETSKWYLRPQVNYSFSDRVRGGAHFEIGKTHNKLIGDSSYKEFMIDVNISIRGS